VPALPAVEPEPPRPGLPPLADVVATSPSAPLAADLVFSPGWDVLFTGLEDALVFSSGKRRLPVELGIAKGDRVVPAPHLAAGLKPYIADPVKDRTPGSTQKYRAYVKTIVGHFPDTAFLILERVNAEQQPRRDLALLEWKGGAWSKVRNDPLGSFATLPPFVGVIQWDMPPEPIAVLTKPYVLGVALALVLPGSNQNTAPPAFTPLIHKMSMPELTPCNGKACVVDASISAMHKECKTILEPRVLAGDYASHWVFGVRCTDGAPAVETWLASADGLPAEGNGVVSLLPSNLDVLAAANSVDKYDIVAVGSRIAQFRENQWQPLPRPPEMNLAAKDFAIESLSMAEDGTLWMTERASKKLWRRKPDGSWAFVEFPAAKASRDPNGPARPFYPRSVRASSKGAGVWVTGCLDTSKEEEEEMAGDEALKPDPDCGAYFVKPR
jgi:hypothetical protein